MKKITLDQPVIYEIKVPGILNENWFDWNGRLKIKVERDLYPEPVSILTISIDQAELHGLLGHLYAFGIPLISVVCKEYFMNEKE
ncbi:MAG: hypothetical protein ACK2U1_12235 [Anaerolineales bacterium]|jgi:hypothetical protein